VKTLLELIMVKCPRACRCYNELKPEA